MISLTKAVTAGSQDDVMKAKNKLIKKFVAAAIIYFVAGIGQFVINKAAGASEKSTVLSCMNCFLYNSGCQDSSSTYQQTHGTQTPSSRNPYSSTNSSSNSNSSTAGGVGTGGGVTVANGNRCTDATIYQGTKYSLTDAQKKKLAAMVYAEYSTDLVGKKAVASHMANLYEYKKAHGTTTKSFYDYITTTTWYASGTRVATTVDATALQAVQDCIIDGKRTLPSNIIEFDMFPGDIVNPKGVNDYEQGKTHVDNKYGASGTFWCMSRDENTGDANIFFSVP